MFAKNMNADTEQEGMRVKKNRTEMTTGATRTESGWSQRSLQLRQCASRKFWVVLGDDRPFYRDSYCKCANVQPKAVFSYAMTVMDKISGWEDEENVGGFKVRGVHVDLHQKGEDRWTKYHS